MKKQVLIGAGVLFIVGLVCLYTIQLRVMPAGDTRMVLDLANETYISPPCFEQAERGNNIAEVSLSKALKFNYKAESLCTIQSLKSVKERLITVLFIKIGLLEDRWDW